MILDIDAMQKFLENKVKLLQEYQSAVSKQHATEPNHLEAMMLQEQNMAEEDGMPLDESELTEIMNKHKDNSPFALDVAEAQSKLMEVFKS